jgi:hypothetical protein
MGPDIDLDPPSSILYPHSSLCLTSIIACREHAAKTDVRKNRNHFLEIARS